MKDSIGFRLNALFVLIVTTLLACSGGLAYWSSRAQSLHQYDMLRSTLRERMQINLVSAVWNLDLVALGEDLTAELTPPVVGIAVFNDEGQLLSAKGSMLPTGVDPSSLDQLEFTLSGQRFNAPQKLATVRVMLSRESMQSALRAEVWRRLLEILVLDVVLVATLSLGLRWLVLRPLAALKDALRKAAEHRDQTATLTLPADRRDEFGEVVRGFNLIAQRLTDDLEKGHQAEQEIRRAYDHLKQTQTSLVEAEKMAALGGLVAGVAHEINTPLGITLTGASVLGDETRRFQEAVDNGSVRKSDMLGYLKTCTESVELILSNARRAAHLVHSFKQVAVDQTSEARRDFDLAVYLDEVVESLSPTYKRLPIHIDKECPAGIAMDGYPGALAQVITNLLVNAVTHAFPDGRSGLIQLAVEREQNGVLLRFEDDGVGIPAEYLPRIFDPFFTTRRGSGGSGLGLHVVYNIVTKRLGGRIEVASTVGQGTRFTMRIPQVAPHPPEEQR